jgi:ATP-binding protein involved in chromosome partitioning
MTITTEHILQALSTVEEPDLKKDLVTLNMIKDIELSVNQVSFTVVLTTPACPLKELIRNSCIEAIRKHVSKEIHVIVNLTADVTSTTFGQIHLCCLVLKILLRLLPVKEA